MHVGQRPSKLLPFPDECNVMKLVEGWPSTPLLNVMPRSASILAARLANGTKPARVKVDPGWNPTDRTLPLNKSAGPIAALDNCSIEASDPAP